MKAQLSVWDEFKKITASQLEAVISYDGSFYAIFPRNRKLLLITKTLLNAIAPAASIGLR
jgi:hypothetical protein